jgi:hypothetical protein
VAKFACADRCLQNDRDLIYHLSADSPQAVALAWLDRQPKQGSTGWVLVNAHTVTESVMSKRSS